MRYGDLALLRGLGLDDAEILTSIARERADALDLLMHWCIDERGISGHRRTMHGRLERPKHGDRYSRRPDPPAVLSNTVAWRG